MSHSLRLPEGVQHVVASGGLEPFYHVVDELTAGRAAVLCVIVKTSGSTPQVTGSMMACDQAGRSIGTVGGGGCLEAAVRRQAWDLLLGGGSLKTVLALNHDVSVRDGMICGGEMTAALVSVAPERAQELELLSAQAREGHEAILLLEVPTQSGVEFYAVHLIASPSLVIAGAGHVGIEVAWVAQRIGFAVRVIDDRPDMLVKSRFPDGVETLCGQIPDILADLQLTPAEYVVICTRGHRDDLDAISAVIKRPLAYLGMLGSKRKIITLFKELSHLGASEEELARIRTPIGLKFGAQTPQEIAVSIAAELISVRRNFSG
ncbi:MAG: XdhC family protein [Candidatus Riflebacteria bacterium]|nr:XdhC family protein [Candidatus Riflebacteria bacterium]